MLKTQKTKFKRRKSNQTSVDCRSPYFDSTSTSSSSSACQSQTPEKKVTSRDCSLKTKSKITSPFFSSSPTSRIKRKTRYHQSSSALLLHGVPRSSNFYGLIQELLYADPYYVLLAASLLNVSAGSLAVPILWKVLLRYPTCHSIARADLSDMIELIKDIGLQNRRARYLKEMGRRLFWIKEENRMRTGEAGFGEIDERILRSLPGVGPYAIDSYQIFCAKPTAQDSLSSRKPLSPLWKSLQAAIRAYEASPEALLPLEVDPPIGWNSVESPIPTILSHTSHATSQESISTIVANEEENDDEAEIERYLSKESSPEPWSKHQQSHAHYVVTKDLTGGCLPEEAGHCLSVDEDQESAEAPWQKVLPKDKELQSYLAWRWAKLGISWDPSNGGVIGQLKGRSEDDDSE